MDKRQDQLKALAGRLERLQQAVSDAEGKPISDSDFARRYLPFSHTTFSRIKSETDPYTGSLDNMADKIAQAEEDVAERLSAVRSASATERCFVQTTLARATQASVKKARATGRRVVVLLAPTGAGKSAVGEALAARGAVYIEGRQSWKKSYKAFCSDIARAAGRPMQLKDYNEHDAEERMLQALKARENVLYLDEANTLSPECVNALKLIVNATGTVVVIAAIPGMWDKLCAGAQDEVEQLVNRCQPILHYKGLTEDDARPFLARSGLSADAIDKCIGQVVEASNEFGAFRTVVALVNDLTLTDKPSAEDVAIHLKFHKKNTAQSGIKRGQTK